MRDDYKNHHTTFKEKTQIRESLRRRRQFKTGHCRVGHVPRRAPIPFQKDHR